ncbi:MAG: hypothetical protein U9Q82_09095 [Chloroflexota bacterium]|nr:hypothetical protein [Chloroflexota bacterium]
MNIAGKTISFLMVVILVILLPISILAYDIGRVIFNPPLVKEVLNDIVTESELIPAALQWYSQRRAKQRYASGEAIAWDDEPDVVDLLSFVNIDGWIIIRKQVLPDEILEEWLSVAVDGTYTWLDSDDRVPDVAFDLSAFKQRVKSEHGRNAIQVVFDSLEPCSKEEIADFKSRLAAAPAGEEVLYNLCRFPEPWFEDQVSDYHESLDDLVKNIPDIFGLTEELADTEDTEGVGPEKIKSQLLLIRALMQWSYLIPAVLLLLILALTVRTLKSLGNWWGIPLTIGGALLLILSLAYQAIIITLLTIGPLSEIPSRVRQEAITAIMQLAVRFFQPLMWQSLVVLVLGVALIIVGVAIKPKTLKVGEHADATTSDEK